MKELVNLIKIRVVLFATLSALVGFGVGSDVFRPGALWSALWLVVGVFLLAAGSAALNQYQERRFDGLMERTRNRPIPSGKLSPFSGLLISLVLSVCGFVVLLAGCGALPAVLGLVTLVCYNGVYTYLKRLTAFAVIPGALTGALPPVIGWTATGAAPWEPALLGLTAFFYLWQIPHFWLIMKVHDDDYRGAGFPTLGDLFTPPQTARIIFTWICATGCMSLLLPLYGLFNHAPSLVFPPLITLWLATASAVLVGQGGKIPAHTLFRRVFRNINIFTLLIMVVLLIDQGI